MASNYVRIFSAECVRASSKSDWLEWDFYLTPIDSPNERQLENKLNFQKVAQERANQLTGNVHIFLHCI